MSGKIFGFAGLESYDLVYYAAKVATNLGFKTLMVDLSEDAALTFLYHDEIPKGDIVNVNGVDLQRLNLQKGSFQEYDYVFMYFGNNPVLLEVCDEIYFVTNFQKNNIQKLKDIVVPNVPRYLIVRDRCACALNTNVILEQLPNLDVTEEEVYYLEDADTDLEARIYLQYSAKTKLSRLSTGIKTLIEHLLDTDSSKKELDKAWSMLKKG